jgi:hypothetical protein
MSEEKKPKKPSVDWDQVAIEIRAGILTDRQIGEKHGRSHGAIQQYAKKHGIERNLTSRIQQRTETKLAKAVLAKETSQELAKLTQEQTIELASEVTATIVIRQQGRIARHLHVSEALLAELESQTIHADLYEKLGEMMYKPDEKGVDKLNDLYRKVITTSSRIDSHKKAVETEKTLIGLERQAFNIVDAAVEPPSINNLSDDDLDRELARLAAKVGFSAAT